MRKSRRRLCTSSVQRKIGHFHVVVVQWRQSTVQKSVMHVQNCCLLIKPIAFSMFSSPSPSSDLKVLISISNLHRVIISGGLCPWKHLIVPHLYTFWTKKTVQVCCPLSGHFLLAGTSILPLKTKTQFLRRRFKFSVNGVLVLAGWHLEKPWVPEGRFCHSGE